MTEQENGTQKSEHGRHARRFFGGHLQYTDIELENRPESS